ncbi:MAG: nucleotidyltransferase domain-containing protein [Nitrospira sp.]|nr:nucleotidyltransferase domain-containing protein [Nitrospira sp.]MDH4303828.1 nucleotidyltransferase domain-containing protein [Nitrospira sp.]MDH5193026.1 nucleotidyltransferase domain-containing protein [Nitrospira sp.]
MSSQELLARPQQIAHTVAALARSMLGADVTVIWFGSWPQGTARAHADIDIAVSGPTAFPPEQLAELRGGIEDLATLHEIDLVDLHTVSERFKQEVLRHGIRL